MKKILALFFFLILLVGCNNAVPVEESHEDSNLEPDIIQVNITVENENGIVTNHSFSHIELYPTFESMRDADEGEFRYLILEEISEFSVYSNRYTFKDLITDEEIDVVFYKNTYEFVAGEEYMIHVFTDVEYDYYFVSDIQHGIFQLKDNRVLCSQKFDNIYNMRVENENEFLELFKKEK